MIPVVGVILLVVITFFYFNYPQPLNNGRNKPQVAQSLQLQDFYPRRFSSSVKTINRVNYIFGALKQLGIMWLVP